MSSEAGLNVNASTSEKMFIGAVLDALERGDGRLECEWAWACACGRGTFATADEWKMARTWGYLLRYANSCSDNKTSSSRNRSDPSPVVGGDAEDRPAVV